MSVVLADLPRSGLGNKIIIWARAVIFAHNNNLKLFVFGWAKLRVGPLKRGERSHKIYFRYFKSSHFSLIIWLSSYFPFIKKKYELMPTGLIKPGAAYLYIFNGFPDATEFFDYIRNYRELITREFYNSISDNIIKQLEKEETPVFSIHIRMGDYPQSMRSPLKEYVNIINLIREYLGICIEVMVFSDGSDNELQDILKIERTKLIRRNNDLLELLMISKSKIILPAIFSSFSYWAAFISDAIIIRHTNDDLPFIRPEGVNKTFYEGKLPDDINKFPSLLKDNLNTLK